MAESNVKITFEIDGLQQSVTSIEDAKKALKGLEDQAKKTETAADDAGEAVADVGKKTEESAAAAEGGLKVIDEAFGGIGTKIKEVGGGLLAMGKKAVSAFKGAIAGANGMKKALIASGIGAIVVALGLIVAYWDDILGLVSGVSSEQKKLLADTEATRDAAQEQLEATEMSEASLKLAGKTEKEIRELKIQQTNEVITATEALLEQQKAQKKAQVDAAKRNRDILQGFIRFLTLPLTLILKTVDGITAAVSLIPGMGDVATDLEGKFSGGLANLVFDPEAVAEEGDATIAETEKTLRQLKNKRDNFILQGQAEDKKAAETKAQNEADANAELARLRAENIEDAEQKALELLRVQYEADRKALVAKKASAEVLLEFDKKYQNDRKAIEDEFAKQRKDAQDAEDKRIAENAQVIADILTQLRADAIEDQFEKARQELQLQYETDKEKLIQAEATATQLAEFQAAYVEKSKKLAKEELEYKKALKEQEIQDALNATSQVLGSIVDLVGEGSAVGKMAALAQNAIDTYASATAAYKSTVGIPYVGPVLAPIAAGVAVAAGLKNAKAIMAIKTPGDKSAPAPSISVPGGNAYDPTAALAGAAEGQAINNQLTLGNQQGSTGATIVKAYVVSSEMTTAQEKDKKINDLARL